MRIGLPLEGVLVDMEAHFNFWISRMSFDADSRFSSKMLRQEGFWASPPPLFAVGDIADLMRTLDDVDEFFIFTERPKSLFPVTRSWLQRNNLNVPDENIVLSSTGGLKRYDCRLHNIDYFIDCDYEVLATFKHDRTIPVGVGDKSDFPDWMQVHETVVDALTNLDVDLRREYIWQD